MEWYKDMLGDQEVNMMFVYQELEVARLVDSWRAGMIVRFRKCNISRFPHGWKTSRLDGQIEQFCNRWSNTIGATAFSILAEIPSGPLDLVVSNLFSNHSTSSVVAIYIENLQDIVQCGQSCPGLESQAETMSDCQKCV